MSTTRMATDRLDTMFSIFFTATCMTIFEILFAYYVAFPQITASVDHNLSLVPTGTAMTNPVVRDELKAFVSMLEQRERKYKDKLNTHSKVFAFLLVITLVIGLTLMGNKYRKLRTLPPLGLSITNVLLILVFQLGFICMTSPPLRPEFLRSMPSWKYNDPITFLPDIVDSACADTDVSHVKEIEPQFNSLLDKIKATTSTTA